jgi:two-component sensor histidine kinase
MTIGNQDKAVGSDLLRAELNAAQRELALVRAERDAANERAVSLQSELQHRVRNMLAVVRSVFSRTVAAGGALDDVADHFRGRLDTLARYQSARVGDINATVDLEQIVRDELHSFQFGDDPKISIEGPEVMLGQDAAQLIALAIHELTTNSIKFGALSTLDGRAGVTVTWTIVDEAAMIRWVEHGVAIIAAAPPHRGFGREFIEVALPYQLAAATSFELRAGGVSSSLTIPLKAIVTRADPFM